MTHFMNLRHSNKQEEVEASVKEFFASKDKIWYQRGTKELIERWLHPLYRLDLIPSGYYLF